MAGLIHIYCGNGKGKTTAAIGLAIRALGAGKQVLFSQFLKNGKSSELNVLNDLKNIYTYSLSTHRGFYKKQNDEERKLTKTECRELFEKVTERSQNGIQLLVLDEIISVCNHEIIDEKSLTGFLENKPGELEVVMTGRDPSQRLLNMADYVTEMEKIRHPYDKGIKARHGIEF
ncbi:MAG: cob(I)yrinic acid a,c-diamide adenosyltransferase [Clostridia bacterium]|nr:cob(I)yrinic acid a,c-diamide adenosyltransferase [Clostridia bacterium]